MKVYWRSDGDETRLLRTDDGGQPRFEVLQNIDAEAGPGVDLIIISANHKQGPRSTREGLRWLQRIRRRGIRSPVVVYSFESFDLLLREFSILQSHGVSFIRLPTSVKLFTDFVNGINTAPISEAELAFVVRWHSGLQDNWRKYSHRLGNLIPHFENRRAEGVQLLAEWAESVNKFAPDQANNMLALKNIVGDRIVSAGAREVRKAIEKLDDGLQGATLLSIDDLSTEGDVPLPGRPPKGYSKILVADDEPQSFLISSLRNLYGYVVLEQALNYSSAKQLLDKQTPDVVLSDYYFKESSRKSAQPDKSVGDKFIRYALNPPQYADTDQKKPIVLVTSKATLRGEIEIRDGAINCSGASRATDPLFIHGIIWAEARRRGVSEPEEMDGQEWTLEHMCRQRLEQYLDALPILIEQWGEFRGTVSDTLVLCRLLLESESNDDPDLVNQLVKALESYEALTDFSLADVLQVFAETEKVHQQAGNTSLGTGLLSKQAIRNIMHGKIEQFSSVSNAIKTLIRTLPAISRDLISMPSHRRTGEMMAETLKSYSETEPLSPFLRQIYSDLTEMLPTLPEVPSPPPIQSRKGSVESTAVRIVVVEDNDYWRGFLVRAIHKTQAILGDPFSISYSCFDNAADALASIPQLSKSFAIEGAGKGGAKTVLIADICLPKNREHAERIRAAAEGRSRVFETPHSTHGLGLIRTVCGYRYNVPLIIFSTVDSFADRKTIGSWGVPDEDFLAKDHDAEETVVRALVRKIEKKSKYVIRRYEAEGGGKFWLNGVEIGLSGELLLTFTAFYELCQNTGDNEVSAADIAASRWGIASEDAVAAIHDQMYRIRKEIFNTLRSNRVFVTIRELISTRGSVGGNFTYRLNAELGLPGEDDDYEIDLEQYEGETCKVLVIENNQQALSLINDILESAGYDVKCATNLEDAVTLAEEFLPHVISLDLQIPRTRAEAESDDSLGDEHAGLEAWKRIRTVLRAHTFGVVLPTVHIDKNYLVAKATQMEIPLRSFISKRDANWLNILLQKVAEEKVRVFLGEIPLATRDFEEPLVEILKGSDLVAGILQLAIDGIPFTMRRGAVSKIIGHLLANPKTVQSLDRIALAGAKRPSGEKDDIKNWTKRIREVIRTRWLTSPLGEQTDLAERILESSARGMRLNVQVIDRRPKTDSLPMVVANKLDG